MVAKKDAKRSVDDAKANAKALAKVAEGKIKTAAGKVAAKRKLELNGRLDTAKGAARKAGQRIKGAIEG